MGLHELHSLPVGPRVPHDVNPQNIIRTKKKPKGGSVMEGTIKLIDLGSAKAREDTCNGQSPTQIWNWCLKAPELVQVKPTYPISQETAHLVDSWGWGCTLFVLLTTQLPWAGLVMWNELAIAEYLLEPGTSIRDIIRGNPYFKDVLEGMGGQEAEHLLQVIESALQPSPEKRASIRSLLALPWFRPCRLAALKAAADAEQQPCLPGAPLSAAGLPAAYLELLQEWREMEGQ